ncbi:MAG: hypothetical protein WKG01_13910 [Kofleriaceae bacterium]
MPQPSSPHSTPNRKTDRVAGMSMPAVTSRVSVDQILDLMVAPLTTIAAVR